MPFTAPSIANKGNRFRIGPRTDILVAVQELVVFTILQDTLMLIPTQGLQPVRPWGGPNQDLALSPAEQLNTLPPGNFEPQAAGGIHVLAPVASQLPLPSGRSCPGPAVGLPCQSPSLSCQVWHPPSGMVTIDDCCSPSAITRPPRQIKESPGTLAGNNCCQRPVLPGLDRQPGQEGERLCYVELVAAPRVLDSTCRVEETMLAWPFIPPGPTPGVPVKVLACRIKNLVSWSRLIPLPSGGLALAIAYYTYEAEILYTDGAGRTAAVTLPSGPRHQQAVVGPGSGYLEVEVRVNCTGAMITSPVIPVPGPSRPYQPARVWLRARPAT